MNNNLKVKQINIYDGEKFLATLSRGLTLPIKSSARWLLSKDLVNFNYRSESSSLHDSVTCHGRKAPKHYSKDSSQKVKQPQFNLSVASTEIVFTYSSPTDQTFLKIAKVNWIFKDFFNVNKNSELVLVLQSWAKCLKILS